MTSSQDKQGEVSFEQRIRNFFSFIEAQEEGSECYFDPAFVAAIKAAALKGAALSSSADTVATPEEWTAISRLLNVAQKATFAMEDSEETGEGHIVPNEQAVELSAALDSLEELPAAPGYASGARSNAAYALRRLLHPKASAVPESGQSVGECAQCGAKEGNYCVAPHFAANCPLSSCSAITRIEPIGEVIGHKEMGLALVQWSDSGLRPIGTKLYGAPVSSTTEPEGYPGIAADCETMREALLMIAGEIPCADNLLGNSDIAQIALEKLTRSATGETK